MYIYSVIILICLYIYRLKGKQYLVYTYDNETHTVPVVKLYRYITSHNSPVYPLLQEHVKPFTSSIHVPFKHCTSHSSILYSHSAPVNRTVHGTIK